MSSASRSDLSLYPPRPYVPPLLIGMIAFVVALNLALRASLSAAQLLAAGCAIVIVAASAGLVAHHEGGMSAAESGIARSAFVAGLCVLMAVPLSMWTLRGVDTGSAAFSSTSVSTLELTIEADPSKTAYGWLSRARARSPDGVEASVWLTSSDHLAYGEHIQAIGRFSPNEEDGWGASSRSRGICGQIRVVRITSREAASGVVGLLVSLRSRVIAAINPQRDEARALMAGALTAQTSELKTQGVEDDFSATGLSHLVAVSGGHLVVMGTCLEALLAWLGAGPLLRALGVVGVSGGYVLFCASPASAVRSWAMLTSSLVGRALGRRAHTPSSMALTGLGMCLIDPTCASDLGFLLSALSVCALALFAPHAEAILCQLAPRHVAAAWQRMAWRRSPALARRVANWHRTLRRLLACTLVCQAATLPACAVAFGRVSLVAPLANVVVGPLFGPIVSIGMIACALSWVPLVGEALLWAASLPCLLAVRVTRILASLPLASVPVSLSASWELAPLVVGAVLLAIWPRPSRTRLFAYEAAVSTLCAVLVCSLFIFVPARVVVLDIGQGDAILVRDGPHALLVDTGPDDAVVEALARQHVISLDAVVLTHLHDDHIGGVDDLVGLVGVGHVYVAEGVSDDLSPQLARDVGKLTGIGAEELTRGDRIRLGGFDLECLWPDEPSDGSTNDVSVCLRLTYGGDDGEESFVGLLTGDAESDVLEHIIDDAGDLDFLKVGHHGSAASITLEQAKELDPEVCVASAGENNSYGHPTPECVETIEASGAVFFCTIEYGDVTVEPIQSGVFVSCERGPPP